MSDSSKLSSYIIDRNNAEKSELNQNHLPKFNIKDLKIKNYCESDCKNSICTICLKKICENDEIYDIPKNAYHSNCLTIWLENFFENKNSMDTK